MAKKVKPETIMVTKYDDIMGESYEVEVEKKAVSACELCSCMGCLAKDCCEHLEYWNAEHGKPARYQLEDLVAHIKRLENIISKLEKRDEAVSQAINLALRGNGHMGVIPEDKAFLTVLHAALQQDPAQYERIFAKREYLCVACSCKKCLDVLNHNSRARLNMADFRKPDCCGHKALLATDLPF